MSAIDIQDHIVSNASYMPSPNHDLRPEEADISLIVIHCISLPPGVYEGNQIEDFFLNKLDISQHEYFNSIKDLKVSSHLLIKRDGEVIQFVPFNKRAWHAGISSFNGVDDCNDYSIGIELEGTDNSEFTDQQYNCLMKITKSLLLNYPNLCKERIVGHSTIAPNRKTDPGTFFNWSKLLDNL